MEATTKLQAVQHELRKISYINSGGCGVAAYFMYHAATGKKPKIYFTYSPWNLESLYHNQNLLHKQDFGDDLPMAPAHIVLSNDNGQTFFDCNGETKDIHGTHPVTMKFLIASIKNKNSWNDAFDRRNIEKIEKATGIDANKIKFL